ncbi:MAG TPA: HAMP domain-containing sensor histidine kinase [Actinomycetota bacterium]|nr:HAMP domain-containing sensor histidine kinase [Actinomycetota bacterium]
MTTNPFAEMISQVAHELRSPLTSLQGFSSTLLTRWDRFTEEQRKEFVETINLDAKRMGRIVSEILDLARLESGRLELQPIPVDLNALAKQAIEGHVLLSGSKRVEVDIPDGLEAWGDPARLAHVFSNLIENAIKFSDDGPITVSAREEDGATVVKVTDQGVGIMADRISGVFTGPGESAGGAASPSGSGLGLYLTRRLVEAHGGTIAVESTEGEGATFTFTLPPGPS